MMNDVYSSFQYGTLLAMKGTMGKQVTPGFFSENGEESRWKAKQ